MKKLYSTIMMLAMMVAALSFTACGGDDDDGDNNGNSGHGGMTLIVDGDSFYARQCNVEQTRGRGMYLNITAYNSSTSHVLVVHISPSKVADLKEGQVFDYDEIGIQTFRHQTDLVYNTYEWKAIKGDITIVKITDMELTIRINDMELEHRNGVKHTVSGTVELDSGAYYNGKLLSFKEAIE